MDRIVIDQSKLRIAKEYAHAAQPGARFPRSLDWWQNFVPTWLDASQDDQGRIVLEPNGFWDGAPQPPAVRRRDVQAALKWIKGIRALDSADAIVVEEA